MDGFRYEQPGMNKLSLHLGKTESILFGSKKILKRVSKLNVTCNGFEIEVIFIKQKLNI